MCSAWWQRESGGSVLLDKQPFHSIQPNPTTATLTAREETLGKAEHQLLPKPGGGGRDGGDMLVVVCKPLAHLWLQDEKETVGGLATWFFKKPLTQEGREARGWDRG